MRYFNTEGVCRPDVHYMVCLDDRLDKIKRLYVDQGKYFIINRGRQYGKTTTLKALAEYLKKDYVVIAMDFQMMSTANFANLLGRQRITFPEKKNCQRSWMLMRYRSLFL